jgi:hypothetical protein
MLLMISNNMAKYINADGIKLLNCKCLQGKAHELSWPGHSKPIKEIRKPGEAIVIDLWGKAPVKTPRGEQYSATFTDVNFVSPLEDY